MKKTIGLLAFLALVAAIAAYYFWQRNQAPMPAALQPLQAPPASPPPAQQQPPTHYPLPQTQETPPVQEQLPPLEQSDTALRNALADLFGSQNLLKLFHVESIVRRFVATVDNLPRKTVAPRLLSTQPVEGSFLTTGKGETLTIAPENAARYTLYVRAAEMVDTKKLVAIYIKFYPLFQQAYQDLGYPKAYFNDRLVTVIDHLLDAPEVNGPIALTQPHVLYEYAAPELESDSAGHKILMRMGQDNEKRIKAKLREIRNELTSGVLKQQ